MLYLFAGKERKSDVRSFLTLLWEGPIEMREVDIERSPSHDLTSESLWASILSEIRQGKYHAAFFTPPCNTWSRARFSNRRGPKPVRNRHWPWGFPWLERKSRSQAEVGNHFVRLSIEGCRACVESSTWWLIEHPEDLGTTSQGDEPASIFQLPEVRELAASSGAFSFAVHQCSFGASTAKPTRFATTLPAARDRGFPGWPVFDPAGKYLGPLPPNCGHRRKAQLIGRQPDGSFKTSASAAYPPLLCKFLAELVVSSAKGKGQQPTGSAITEKHDSGSPRASSAVELDVPFSSPVASFPPGTGGGDEPTSDEDFEGEPLCRSCPGGEGSPLSATIAGKNKPFTDGAGLCSPGRWPPEQRLVPGQWAQAFRDKLFLLLSAAVKDPQRLVFELATGKHKESPWPPGLVEQVRYEWAASLPRGGSLLFAQEFQPFFLPLIGDTLQQIGDPDWKIYERDPQGFTPGVPIGFGEKLPRTPAVFERKTRWRAYDEVSSPVLDMDNYRSTVGLEDVLRAQFLEEQELGMMYPCTLEEAKKRWPGDRLRIAAQGALEKGDASWRVVHDGTHGVAVNHGIRPRDQLAVPSVGELRTLLSLACSERPGVHFSIQADIKKAHRRVRHKDCDWGLLACRADPRLDEVWINRCGCFGIGSAAYWWSRLAAGIARIIMAVYGRDFAWQLVYVDDLLWMAWGPLKYWLLLTALLLWEACGAPFSWHKTRGGLQQDWVCYWYDAGRCQVGISSV